MQKLQPRDWWRRLEEEAVAFNPTARVGLREMDEPRLIFWQAVSSPSKYERLSRERMKNSGVVKWAERAGLERPVEGASEIDVIVETRRALVFIEAKLMADISERTRYDPARNQIARNIDCLLERSGSRDAAFWMLVRDTDSSRMYSQLVEQYRFQPELLERDLPHRDPKTLRLVADRLALIRWKDLAADWLERTLGKPVEEAVRLELLKRI